MDSPRTRPPWPILRALLILGRISNCPTVWSNCLAAWWLAGGGPWARFGILCVGTTLLYTGGMFLNDACDVAFDRRYRPERPIPSGILSRGVVTGLGMVFLVSGGLLLRSLGIVPAGFAGGLSAVIVVYDLVHKRTIFAPVLMSFCRFLVYLLAASSARFGVTAAVLWGAAALAIYVCALSYLARTEATSGAASRWLYAPHFVPIVLGLAISKTGMGVLIPAGVLALWLIWCLPRARVSGLLAGIALVDWVAAANHGPQAGVVLVGLFLLALVLQRVVPAT